MVELRDFHVVDPDGSVAHIKWFGPSKESGPSLIINVQTGDGTGIAAPALVESRTASIESEARAQGAAVEPRRRVSVLHHKALISSDPLGWRSLSVFANDDAVVAVTGLRVSDDVLIRVASGLA